MKCTKATVRWIAVSVMFSMFLGMAPVAYGAEIDTELPSEFETETEMEEEPETETESETETEPELEQTLKGWQGNSYYINNEKVIGWKKIKGKHYYFDQKGNLVTNQIVYGKGETDTYYVDKTGVRVNDKVIKKAVKFVLRHTKKSWSREKKMKELFTYMVKEQKYQSFNDPVSASKLPDYASCVFDHDYGNCYRSATAYVYVATVLGYDARLLAGKVSSRRPIPNAVHGWADIKVGSNWKLCDISMQRPRPKTSLYMLKHSKYPFAHKFEKKYTIRIENGKVTWKGEKL